MKRQTGGDFLVMLEVAKPLAVFAGTLSPDQRGGDRIESVVQPSGAECACI